MFEKCNPSHPDKLADRIAGALVDLAYAKQERPKVAIEVLIGHNQCHIIAESSYPFTMDEALAIVIRIAGPTKTVILDVVAQDERLAHNQEGKIRCGDNGIFKGVPVSGEERTLSDRVRGVYAKYPTDGKYLCYGDTLVACQSNATAAEVENAIRGGGALMLWSKIKVNPLGDWTGGTDVDTGATNRKLGSDMGRAATGGGLHGKDLSKADVSVNVFAHILAQQLGEPVELSCAIGDEKVGPFDYDFIVSIARDYIFNQLGGFEKMAEWGLI